MTKRLFLFGAALAACAGAFAQGYAKFDRPSAANYEFAKEVKSTSIASEWWEGTDTTMYVLYNVDADAFFKQNTCYGHERWQSHAALKKNDALQLFFAQYREIPVVEEGVEPTVEPWDGVTYQIINYGQNGSGSWGWRPFYPTSMFNSFVDWVSDYGIDYKWNIKAMGNSIFRLSVSPLNPNWNPELGEKVYGKGAETYAGFYFEDPAYSPDATDPVMPLTPMLCADGRVAIPEGRFSDDSDDTSLIPIDPSNPAPFEGHIILPATVCINWKVMPVSEYNKWRDNVKAWEYIDSGALQSFIDEVKNNSRVDVSALEALANSTTPVSWEELEAARLAVEDAYLNNRLNNASEDNPVDITDYLANPDFESGNTNGWTLNYVKGSTVTNLGYQSASYSNGDIRISKFIEAWANSSYSSATTKRSLGNGSVYQTVKDLPAGKYVFTCDAIAVGQDESSVRPTGAYLFAKSGDNIFSTPIATGNEKPEHFEVTFFNTEDHGDFDFGFMTENTTANWMACDNFTLTYYGRVQGDPFKVLLDERIAEIKNEFPIIENIIANLDVKGQFSEAMEHAQAATSDFVAEKEALNAAYDALVTSVKEYEYLATLMEDTRVRAELLEDFDDYPGLFDILTDFVNFDMEEAYTNQTADGEFIAGLEATINQTVKEHILENLKPGTDVTPLIINGDFYKNAAYWNGTAPAFGGKGANGANAIGDVEALNSGCVEYFHKAFDLNQTITGLPAGSYTVSVQAYERNDDGYVAHWEIGPTEGITTVLYGNEFESKICNILAEATEDPAYMTAEGEGVRYTDYGGYIPNTMDAANFYFASSPKTYRTKRNVVLAEDGDLKIGMRTSATNSWVIFDNFRLIYNGNDPRDFDGAIDEAIEMLENVFANNEPHAKVYETSVAEAIEALKAAKQGDDVVACVEAIALCEEVYADATQSISLCRRLEALAEPLSSAIEGNRETAMADVMADAEAAFETIMKATLGEVTNDVASPLIPHIYKLIPDLQRHEGEVDIQLLPWVRGNQDCINALGQVNAGNVYGTDTGSNPPISYVDVTGCEALVIYAPYELGDQVARFFINREEYGNDGIFYVNIIGGVGVFDLQQVYDAQPGASYIHLNGCKASSASATVTVNEIKVRSNAKVYYEQIDEMIAKLEGAFDGASAYSSIYEDAVDDAIDALNKAKSSTNSMECVEAIANGEKAYNDAQKSIELYASLALAQISLNEAVVDYSDNIDEALQAEIDAILARIDKALEEKTITNEDLDKLIGEAKYYSSKAQVPAGEIDITTLPWIRGNQDCINNLGVVDAQNVFGTDTGTDTPISYVDITGCEALVVYGPTDIPEQEARFFINRAEGKQGGGDDGIFTFTITNGKAVFDLQQVYDKMPYCDYIHLNGVKARSWNTYVTINLITVRGIPDGVHEITALQNNGTSAAYNVAGQAVSDSYKGIVIRNGKKTLQK